MSLTESNEWLNNGHTVNTAAGRKTDVKFPVGFHTDLLEHSVSLTDELAHVRNNPLFALHQLILVDLGITHILFVQLLCLRHLEETERRPESCYIISNMSNAYLLTCI